jgi:branched-chain amino acid transport system substrate-binding protein
MKTKIIFGITIAAIIAIIFFAGCTQQNQPGEEKIRIGVLLSLSGDAAFFGESELKGIQMAVDEVNEAGGINGQAVELIVEDTGTLNTPATITALQKLVNVDGVSVIIGPTWDMPGVTEVAEKEKIVLISPDNIVGITGEKKLEYFFSTWQPQKAEMLALAKFAKERNLTQIVILKDTDIYSEVITKRFLEAVNQQRINVLGSFSVITGTKDFRTELIKIKEMKPDAIMAAFVSESPRGPLLKQIKELDLKTPVLANSAVEDQALLNNFSQYAENTVFFASPNIVREKEFLSKFEAKYQTKPVGPGAPNAYDAAIAIVTAYKSEARTADEIKTFLKTHTFPSMTFGQLQFDENGFVSSDVTKFVIKTVKNGQFIPYEGS